MLLPFNIHLGQFFQSEREWCGSHQKALQFHGSALVLMGCDIGYFFHQPLRIMKPNDISESNIWILIDDLSLN